MADPGPPPGQWGPGTGGPPPGRSAPVPTPNAPGPGPSQPGPPAGWGADAPGPAYRPQRQGSTARTVAAVLLGLAVVVAILGGLLFVALRPVTDTLAPGFDAAQEVIAQSGGRVAGARYQVTNSIPFLEVRLAQGRTARDATDVACTVVAAALARHQLTGTDFGVFSADGDLLADEDDCPQG